MQVTKRSGRRCEVDRQSRLVGILIGLFAFGLLASPPFAPEAEATVYPISYDGLDFPGAISAADPGDTLRVVQNGYQETSAFTINKSLLIEVGSGVTATLTEMATVDAQGVTLRGLTVEAGVYLESSGDGLVVEECSFTGGVLWDIGSIMAGDPGLQLTVRRSTFGDATMAIMGDEVTSTECGTCCLLSLYGLVVEECVFVDVDYPIILGCWGYGTVSGNLFVGAEEVLSGEYGSPWTEFSNNIVVGVADVFPEDCPAVIEDNIFYNNTSIGCTVDWDENLDDDPLFCEAREGTQTYTLRMDSPAVAANNSLGEDIGPFGVECAWGTLARNTTVGDATVQVLEDVTVPSGLDLTLDAGVSLRFDDDDNSVSGSDTSLNELIINGALEVNGSSSHTVQFVSSKATPAEGDWYGIDVRSGGSASIDYAEIRHATYGARVRTNESSEITRSQFASNENYDILAGAGGGSSFPLRLAHNTITVGGGTGIDFQSVVDGAVVDTNSVIGSSSSTSGVKLDFYTYGSDVTLTGNTVSGFSNGAGVWEFAAAGLTMIKNSVSDSKWGVQVTNGSPAIGTTSSESDNYITDNVTGVYVDKGAGGTSTPIIRNNYIASNTYGVVATGGAQPDLGTGTNSRGNNYLAGNSTYCIWNRNAGGTPQIPAQYNYFGECEEGNPPYCVYGNVDNSNGLCMEPERATGFQMVATPLPPKGLRITGVSPNPMLSGGEIHLSLEQGQTQVKLDLFDVTGRLVRSFGEFEVGPGQHLLHWDGLNQQGVPVRSGIYFVRGRSTDGQQTGARILVAR